MLVVAGLFTPPMPLPPGGTERFDVKAAEEW